MRSLFIGVFSLLVGVGGERAFADDNPTGSISIEVTDAAKHGVAGIKVSASIAGSAVEYTGTTGAVDPPDAELAAAAKSKDPKALEVLKSKYAAHADITGIAYGMATITLDIKGAKPLTAAISKDKPTWKIEAIVDAKTKKLVGVAKLSFDEVANARAQVANAKAAQDAAKAAKDDAKAAQDAAKAAQEAAKAEQERAKSDAAKSEADAAKAKSEADAERLKRQRLEAPSKVSASAGRCDCKPGKQIQVRCEVKNDADVPVVAFLNIFAETGSFKINSSGTGKTQPLAAHTTASYDFLTTMSGGAMNCSSCTNQKCSITKVEAQ